MEVGDADNVGNSDGWFVNVEGAAVGVTEGFFVGSLVGKFDGIRVVAVGTAEGISVGDEVCPTCAAYVNF